MQIEGEKYRWIVGHHEPDVRYTDPPGELLVTVVVRGVGNDFKLHATFHGFALRDVWQKELVQNLTIAPSLVRSLIAYAREKQLTRIAHAEQVFPEAVLPEDADREFYLASCRQWFRGPDTLESPHPRVSP